MVLLKKFWEIFIFWSKTLKIGRFIEEGLFFHMVATLEICLGRLVKVKIALRHFHPGSSLRYFRPDRRYAKKSVQNRLTVVYFDDR